MTGSAKGNYFVQEAILCSTVKQARQRKNILIFKKKFFYLRHFLLYTYVSYKGKNNINNNTNNKKQQQL